ncbi:riboflavin synthase [Nitrospiraceae bacterium AH_259_D15_M11_P09]|nr:riboflavin synthase [Nitrospiraceae bacterium AH_259_D15_M11_P09]
MFTGIVEEIGVVKALESSLAGTRLTILASTVMETLTVGASVSVNGACLTVVAVGDREFSAEVSRETLSVTALGRLITSAPVNLERALKINERIDGHLVSGHVDGVGTLTSRRQEGNAIVLRIEAPKEVLRYCVPKGSITVDGASLTINELNDRSFSVAIIPHTAKVTTLGVKQAGETVNLEADLIGKYVERLLQERGNLPPKPAPAIDREYLQKRGLI